MKSVVKELGDYLCENDYPIDKNLVLKIKELIKKEREQMIDFYTWMRINDSAEEYFHYSDQDMLTKYQNK